MLTGILWEPGLEQCGITQHWYSLRIVGPPLCFVGEDLKPGSASAPKGFESAQLDTGVVRRARTRPWSENSTESADVVAEPGPLAFHQTKKNRLHHCVSFRVLGHRGALVAVNPWYRDVGAHLLGIRASQRVVWLEGNHVGHFAGPGTGATDKHMVRPQIHPLEVRPPVTPVVRTVGRLQPGPHRFVDDLTVVVAGVPVLIPIRWLPVSTARPPRIPHRLGRPALTRL